MNILDFVMVGSDDHEKSGDFYDAVFEPLKLKRVLKTQKYLGYAHSSDPEKVQFYVTHPVNGKDATFGNGTQITLLADLKKQLKNFMKLQFQKEQQMRELQELEKMEIIMDIFVI